VLKLSSISPNLLLRGVKPGEIVRVKSVEWLGPDSIELVFRNEAGGYEGVTLNRANEADLEIATSQLPWTFTANAADFKMGVEALRMRLGHLFDPLMAVHSSDVDPLPHQIAAVYEYMLPKQPLRFVLADDPGAGKTIMAGLLIRELMIRGDTRRVLVVAPGSLCVQWQDEMKDKFGLDFGIFSREKQEQSSSGNFFQDLDLLIVRLDQLSRNDDYIHKLKLTSWDLIIVDEAHKMSASYFGQDLKETKRYQLGMELEKLTRHFLLMTATPHNGKEDDFRLFMSLVDRDRFAGRPRNGETEPRPDVSDVMRRMVKEELVRFDGKPLFPPRWAHTAGYELSPMERALYEDVTSYVREEMNRADKLDEKRKGNVGFALTLLQRRLASSPEAIYQSLKRRHKKLESQLEELKTAQRGGHVAEILTGYQTFPDVPNDADEAFDEMDGGDYENWAETVVNRASAARTMDELRQEIAALHRLEQQAHAVVQTRNDRKWEQLSLLLQETPEMFKEDGSRRKLIVFTEHRDTLNYLVERIGGLLGRPDAVLAIHGGVQRELRYNIQTEFRNNPDAVVLIATDAAGEGVNLQNANLMINYDLPWNPNRIEQRFGRIHRIGQREVCHLWNLLARNTREGDVFERLFKKMETASNALGGKVYDVLGELFEDKPLRELLITAIRRGEEAEVREYLNRVIDTTLDLQHIEEVRRKHTLVAQSMSPDALFAVKEEMEKAEARKLQPFYVKRCFLELFTRLKGELREREQGRWEIRHIPAAIKEEARESGNLRTPVAEKYQRICFEKAAMHVPGKPVAELMHPGHPLMAAMIELWLGQSRALMQEGSVFVDPDDDGSTPSVLVILEHTVRESSGGSVVSRRLQFVRVPQHGTPVDAGYAPHTGLRAASDAERSLVADVLSSSWLSVELQDKAYAFASDVIAAEHFREVKSSKEAHAERVLAAVHERLTKEINHWENRYLDLQDQVAKGKQPKVQLDNTRQKINELSERLAARKKQLEQQRAVVSATPLVLGAALVIPQGLLEVRRGNTTYSIDAEARRRVELIAMRRVMDVERGFGHDVSDVSADKCGWDVTARPKPQDGSLADARHIEVKGRAKGQDSVTVTYREIITALNDGDRYILAIVLVDGDQTEGPYYIRRPFSKEPEDEALLNSSFNLDKLLQRAVKPEDTV